MLFFRSPNQLQPYNDKHMAGSKNRAGAETNQMSPVNRQGLNRLNTK
jgi:hypothetical protein